MEDIDKLSSNIGALLAEITCLRKENERLKRKVAELGGFEYISPRQEADDEEA